MDPDHGRFRKVLAPGLLEPKPLCGFHLTNLVYTCHNVSIETLNTYDAKTHLSSLLK